MGQMDADAAYLQHEVNGQCASRDYIPRTDITVQIYADTKQCCRDTKDAQACVRRGCALQAMDKGWGPRSLAYRMMLTGNLFRFRLDEYVLEGGDDVNGGRVSNALSTGFLETAASTTLLDEKISATDADFNAFKNGATGMCGTAGVDSLFSKVTLRDGKFHFKCAEAEALCKCLTETGLSVGSVAFKGPKHTLELFGNGKTLEYKVSRNSRRRRLLQYRRGC